MRIYVDLDDVFVNFRDAAAKLHGYEWRQVEQMALDSGVWDMRDWFKMSDDEFWAPINELGEEYWLGLGVNPWANKLVAMLDSTGLEWFIATSPSKHISSYLAKTKFLHNFLSHDRFFVTRYKYLLGDPGDVLIDDREETLAKFESRGELRRGIIFPALGNRLHDKRADPLPYVARRLELCI